MPNTREKLAELLDDIHRCGEDYTAYEIYGMRVPDTVSNEDVADHLIAHGVTVQEWISVKDKLPEECPHPYDDMAKAVLIYTPVDGYTHIGWYAGKDYRGRYEWKTLSAMRSYQTCTKKVSHWCYLPQPPKGE